MRQPKLPHKKCITPIAATQLPIPIHRVCEIRVCIFIKIKIAYLWHGICIQLCRNFDYSTKNSICKPLCRKITPSSRSSAVLRAIKSPIIYNNVENLSKKVKKSQKTLDKRDGMCYNGITSVKGLFLCAHFCGRTNPMNACKSNRSTRRSKSS